MKHCDIGVTAPTRSKSRQGALHGHPLFNAVELHLLQNTVVDPRLTLHRVAIVGRSMLDGRRFMRVLSP